MDFKDRMIEAYERGECSYEGSYDYVRESMADAADLARKREKENAFDACRCRPKDNYYVRSCAVHGVLQEEKKMLADLSTKFWSMLKMW